MLKEKNKLIFLIGIILIVIGIAIGTISFFSSIKNQQKENEKINEYLEVVDDKHIQEKSDTSTTSTTPTISNKINYSMILEIPKINIKKGLYDIKSRYNSVNYNIQILKESDMPDVKNGNLILAGHNGNSSISYFRMLDKLNKDDLVYIYYNGIKYTYKIDAFYETEKDGTITIHKDKLKNAIVLITCKKNTTDKQLVYIGYLTNESEY